MRASRSNWYRSLCEQAAGPGSCALQSWMLFRVNRVYLVGNVRSHFQMEVDILEISLDILAIWHAVGELPMFLVSLSRPLRSRLCNGLRLAAAGSFGFDVR